MNKIDITLEGNIKLKISKTTESDKDYFVIDFSDELGVNRNLIIISADKLEVQNG